MDRRSPVAFVYDTACDLASLREFMERLGKQESERYRAWESRWRTMSVRAVAHPASDAPSLVGVLLVSLQKRHLRIEAVGVDPVWRRLGIATNLFYRMLLDPRSHRYETVSAICPDNNDPAIAWLRHCRCLAIAVLPASNPDARDQYLFSWSWKNLSPGERDAISVCAGTLPGNPSDDAPPAPTEG